MQKPAKNFTDYKYVDELGASDKLRRLVWDIVWLICARWNPRFTLDRWRIFLCRLFGAKIGKGCRISPSCKIWAPWNLEMGDYVALGPQVDCYTMNKILIGSKVAISQRAFICTGSHAISSLRRPLITSPIFISDHCWVAAEAFIGPGVTLGEGAVVAARSVVVKDVPSFVVVAGNPASTVKRRVLEEDNVA